MSMDNNGFAKCMQKEKYAVQGDFLRQKTKESKNKRIML